MRGGFPLSFLAASDADSAVWRKQFVQTFLERDLPGFGLRISPATMFRFWKMLAHYHGQIWNASEIASAMGADDKAVRRYLDLLTSLFMVRQLQPWHENLGKRQVKSPKVYFRDSGILHHLIGATSEAGVLMHPKSGASWEGYAVEQAIQHYQPDEVYFWAVHNGAELDLLFFKNGKRVGIECKRQDAPKLTASMKTAFEDLKLDELTVLYPGTQSYSLAPAYECSRLHSWPRKRDTNQRLRITSERLSTHSPETNRFPPPCESLRGFHPRCLGYRGRVERV